MKWGALGAVLLLATAAQGQPAWQFVESANILGVCGNGRLTIGVNRTGGLSSFRWPSPAGHDQLRYTAPAIEEAQKQPTPQGAWWAFSINGQVQLLSQNQSPQSTPGVLHSTHARQGVGQASQRLFVHSARDLLALRLSIHADSEPRIFWYQNFAPTLRQIPQLPVGDWLADATNDFAAFAGRNGAAYQFRPEGVDAGVRTKAQDLARKHARDEDWGKLGAGVWLAATGALPPKAVYSGNEEKPDAAFHSVVQGQRFGVTALGACDTGLELSVEKMPENVWTATVFIAAGATKASVDATLAEAREAGFDRLQAETETHWKAQLAAASSPAQAASLHTLSVATDAATNLTVRVPITQPPLALVDAQSSAWIAWARREAGQTEPAGQQALLAARTVRLEDGEHPRGSMPLATYLDGVPAAPAFLNNLEQNAFFLGGLWQHARQLPPEAVAPYLEPARPAFTAAADFLVAWTHGLDGRPLHAFDPRVLHDRRTDQHIALALVGLQCARNLTAALTGPENEAWRTRERAFEAFVLQAQVRHQADPTFAWDIDLPTALWLQAILEEPSKLWDLPVQTPDGTVSLRTLTWAHVFPPHSPPPPAVHYNAVIAAQYFLADRARTSP